MKKPGAITYGLLCLILGVAFLSGCDLLAQMGIGTKKQDSSQSQPVAATPIAVVAPTSQSTTEIQGPLPSDALVRIGNWTLTQEEFNDRLNLLKQQLPDFKSDDPNAKSAVLVELIRQELLVK